MPSKQIKLDPPDSLLQPCALVPELPINATVSDLMQDDLNLIKIYGECQIELKALQKWVTEP